MTADGEKAEFLDRLDQIRAEFDNHCEMFGTVLESEFAVRRLRGKLEAQDAQALQLQQNSSGGSGLPGRQNTAVLPFAIHPDPVASIHFRATAPIQGRSIERDNLAMARNSLIEAREALSASEIRRVKAERDRLAADLRRQTAERDKFAQSQQAALKRVTMERDNLAKLIVARESELAGLKAECSRLTDLSAARELQAEHERNLLTTSLNTVAAERDSLAAACSNLEIAHSAMLSSRSWRFTAPLRFVRRLFG
jgi:hypothetical protein